MAEDPEAPASAPSELIVCVTCRRHSSEDQEEGPRPGRVLYDSLASSGMPEGVSLIEANCLQNCEDGCTVVLRGGERWTYVFGNIDETSQSEMLLDGVAQYHAADDGVIPWRERPEHFKRNCVARIPPPQTPDFSHD